MKHRVTLTTSRSFERELELDFPVYLFDRRDENIWCYKFESPDTFIEIRALDAPEGATARWFEVSIVDEPMVICRFEDLLRKHQDPESARNHFKTALCNLKDFLNKIEP